MDSSILLARILGLAGSLSTLFIILRYRYHLSLEEEAAKNRSAIYISGFSFMLMGVVIIVLHQIWVRDWRVIITILGWIILLKGLLRMAMPEKVHAIIARKKSNPYALIGEVVSFMIALFLLYEGFFGH